MKSVFKGISFFTAAILFTACTRDVQYNPPATAMLHVVHASPDAPAVDIYIDGKAFTMSPLAYPERTVNYNLFLGNHTLAVRPSGTLTNVLDEVITLSQGSKQHVFIVDSVSKVSALMLADDMSTPDSGKAHVRFVHLSPNAPAVFLAYNDTTQFCGNTSFKGSSVYTPINAGLNTLEIRLAGTGDLVKVIPDMNLEAGRSYTLAAVGFVGGTGKQALSVKLIEE